MAATLNELLIEIQDLIGKLESLGFGGPFASVTHNGITRPTLQKAIADKYSEIQAMVQGRQSYETKALMDADLAHHPDVLATVWNDPVKGNNGLFGKLGSWGGGVWKKSEYDPAFTKLGFDVSASATSSGYIDLSGVLVEGAGATNWLSSGFVSITEGVELDFDVTGHTAVNCVSFYDSSKVFISGNSSGGDNQPGARFNQVVTSPQGAEYYRISFGHPENNPVAIGNPASVLLKLTAASKFNSMEAIYDALTERVDLIASGGVELSFDVAAIATGIGYIDTSGILTNANDTNWLCSDFIAIDGGVKLDFDVTGHTAVNCVSFYDSSKVFISGNSSGGDNQPGARFNQVVTSPQGAEYYRISFGHPENNPVAIGNPANVFNMLGIVDKFDSMDKSFISLREGVDARSVYRNPRSISLAPADKVLLYGTSISSLNYPWYKDSMESLTGATVYPAGFSGAPASSLASNASLQRIFDYGAKVIIVMVGGNTPGSVGTVGTFNGRVAGEPIVVETDVNVDYEGAYFIQAISHIIRKILAYYADFRSRAGLTGLETESEKEAKIDAVEKPMLVFCTPIPQKRNDALDAFSQPENWERKRDAVVECCEKYGVHCVDLYNKVPFDMSLEPYFTPPTDVSTNNGLYYMDGLHPNKYGYRVISELICADVGL